ncbi:hypothetical protein D1632_10835 [Chryseobacterium nematophagum]|uniref:Uncharacterized protein n=1 Tax=Chryseobacterium nematophagum TaxID=2305228 RepID=A0A3M7LEY7_9FLAO|nr:hypothetical protein [Chryseobacterium nematophagum]RMZ60076.1 hypothetical protein D1632_10835 [Chryseobacterium nematophagum]
MNYQNLEKYIDQSDFNCVGLVAQHCDLKKLCIATEEAKAFDVIPLFCFEFIHDILNHWDQESDEVDFQKYQDLICGTAYTNAHGKLRENMGFKKVWVYYSYARYLLINQFNDSANGTVKKQNEWSISTSHEEITDLSNKYRRMGKQAYESVLEYLCSHKELFPQFEDCHCKLSCGCSGKCSCGKTKKMTGFKFSTIRK